MLNTLFPPFYSTLRFPRANDSGPSNESQYINYLREPTNISRECIAIIITQGVTLNHRLCRGHDIISPIQFIWKVSILVGQHGTWSTETSDIGSSYFKLHLVTYQYDTVFD